MSILTKLFGNRDDRVNERLHAVFRRIAETAIERQGTLDTEQEARKVVQVCAIPRKSRAVAAYKDVAEYLLSHYDPIVAYFIAVNIDIEMQPVLGYIPIGQIVLAVEQTTRPDHFDKAADFLACAILNLKNIPMARQAFTVYKVPAVRDLVAAKLRAYDADVAASIVG
jgi:hypothetical protein